MITNILITAGGTGSRFGIYADKLFMHVGGVPVIIRSIKAFSDLDFKKQIFVAARPALHPLLKSLCISYGIHSPIITVPGGATRQDSISAMLKSIKNDDGLTAIHDGARPLVNKQDLENIFLLSRQKPDGIILASKTTDTVKIVKDGFINSTLDRNLLYNAQTPQIFNTSVIKNAYENAQKDNYSGTDDASLVERMGKKVTIYESKRPNPKITYKYDIVFCEALLNG